jgi:hypothetical protein
MRRRNATRITAALDLIYFDGVSGQVLQAKPLGAAISVQRWFMGLHMASFAGAGLRWLYFALGLAGCVTIAAGMLIWLESHRSRSGALSHRLVEGLVIASICGPMTASAAYLLANRVLPAAVAHRALWEMTGAPSSRLELSKTGMCSAIVRASRLSRTGRQRSGLEPDCPAPRPSLHAVGLGACGDGRTAMSDVSANSLRSCRHKNRMACRQAHDEDERRRLVGLIPAVRLGRRCGSAGFGG